MEDQPSTSSDTELTVDLDQGALDYVEFLREVSDFPALYSGPLLPPAIDRYEKYWLPLAAENPDQCLTAPLDIEWVWHCHMLSPLSYRKDCKTIVGRDVDHQVTGRTTRLPVAKELWEKAYPSEPFEVDLTGENVDKKRLRANLSSYDIAEAAARQRTFFYQISLPHYKDRQFLAKSVQRYKDFLHLKSKNPSQKLLPSHDIDVIWRTHLIHPHKYKEDTKRLLGRIFEHNDNISNRSIVTDLRYQTQRLWESCLKSRFAVNGCLARGEPSENRFYVLSEEEVFSICTKSTILQFQVVSVEGVLPKVKQFCLKIAAASGSTAKDILTVLEGPENRWVVKSLLNYKFDTKVTNNLQFKLEGTRGCGCCERRYLIGERTFELLQQIENAEPKSAIMGKIIPLNVVKGGRLNVRICAVMTAPTRGPCLLFLRLGRFEKTNLSVTLENLWGALPSDPSWSEGCMCSVATHSLVTNTKKLAFTVKVIHNLQMHNSIVEVWCRDSLAAVSHLVGEEQLPLPSQVENSEMCVTLDPTTGQKAMLIKNNGGDWSVIKGRWTKRSDAGESPIECCGYLSADVYKFSVGQWQQIDLSDANSFTFDHLTVSQKLKCIRIDETSLEIPEYVALAFSVYVLQVWCQPKSKNIRLGGNPNLIKSSVELQRNMPFVTSAGCLPESSDC